MGNATFQSNGAGQSAKGHAAQLQQLLDERTQELRECKAKLLETSKANEVYRAIFELAPVGIVHAAFPDGRFLTVNQRYADFTGYSIEELLSGMTVWDITHPDDLQINSRNLHRLLSGEVACSLKKRYVRRSGHIVWIEGAVSFIRDADGHPTHSIAVVQDITNRKRGEEQLQLWADAFAHCTKGMAVVDAGTSRVLAANPAYARLIGRTSGEMEGLFIPDLFPPEERERREQFLPIADKTGSVSYQSWHLRPDQKAFPVQVDLASVKDSDGAIRYRLATVEDISERLESEAALRASEAKFHQLADAMPQIVWTARADGWVDYCNLRWSEYTGMTLEETQGGRGVLVLHPDDLQRWTETWARAVCSGEDYNIEYRFKRADDAQYRWHLGRAVAVKDETGQVIKWFGTCTDIDDRKKLEIAAIEQTANLAEQTKRAEEANRLKSVFLANMSHELRTPLNGILGFAELLHDQIPGELNPTQQDFLSEILKSSRHLLRLINDLLDLAKIEAGKLYLYPQWVPTAALIDDVMSSQGAVALQNNIDLSRDCDDVPEVWIDPRVGKQVLYNYLSNAIKFTPAGGRIHIRASQGPEQSVCFEVSDTGEGIRPEEQGRLFRRYEQLGGSCMKAQSGTGLGLALVKEIVGLLGGSVGVDSTLGKGSRFWARWPQPAPETARQLPTPGYNQPA